MKHLYLLRHAKASWDSPVPDDHSRPLASRGERDARHMGRYICDHIKQYPQQVLCSSAVRTKTTLSIILKTGLDNQQPKARVKLDDDLYLCHKDYLLSRIKRLDNQTDSALIVGHHPSLQELALDLTGRDPDNLWHDLAGEFPTCTLTGFQLPIDNWQDLQIRQNTLTHYMTPKKLRQS